MKSYLRTTNQEIRTIVSEETGEEIDVQIKSTKILVEGKENFIQLYTSIEAKLLGLSLAEERVFFYAILNCSIDNTIYITQYAKKIISEKWNIALTTIPNCLTVLHKEGLLVRIDRGLYKVNPQYVWKSNSSGRKENLKHFLDVECKHC